MRINILARNLQEKKYLIRSCLKKPVIQILTGQYSLNISTITVLGISKRSSGKYLLTRILFHIASAVGQLFNWCLNCLLQNCCFEVIECIITFNENSFMVLGLT